MYAVSITNNSKKLSTLLIALPLMLLAACGGGGGSSTSSDNNNDNNSGPSTTLASIYPYQDSAYSGVLNDCVRAYQDELSCFVDVLPPLGIGDDDVTIEDIMSRVVVSHDWMGQRFERFLQQASPSMIAMFEPLTAVVIAFDIRPAFYHPLTGAMYIDPAFLWLSPAEYASIDDSPDYRSGFGNELALDTGWRYVNSHGNYITTSNFSDGNDSRTFDDIIPGITNLLFHELAHANDFLPPDIRNELLLPLGDDSFFDVIDQVFADKQSIQQRVTEPFPLINNTLKTLASVLFGGEDASNNLLQLSAAEAGQMFAIDGASDMYNYYTSAEDVAMLFEEAMMSYSMAALRDVAFLNNDNDNYCDQTIGWAQRGRIGEFQVNSRAQMVVSLMLPEQAEQVNAHLADLAPAQVIPSGLQWCDSRTALNTQPLTLRSASNAPSKTAAEQRLPIGH
ncbi:hypothetical protein IC617_13450 [Neiella sp. HB171785]|uniref:Uncharacterized protein n=1 Tax=Neiella litorisoli TaxID=2771431 RepID=A0A8J6QRR2_9GAMM|nr:hypothetical protein [Neiella litorisoli]MBD1390441.1 hypothetical protein [Neiella litorisoli]